MLTLISSDHVDGLLDNVEVKVLVTERRSEVEVAIDKCLRSRHKERVDIGLVPTSLLYRLKLGVQVV